MSSSRTGPPLRVAPSGLFSWLPLWSSPLLLFSLQVPLFLPAHRITTSRSACLELRGHDSMFPPSRCAIRGQVKMALAYLLSVFALFLIQLIGLAHEKP